MRAGSRVRAQPHGGVLVPRHRQLVVARHDGDVLHLRRRRWRHLSGPGCDRPRIANCVRGGFVVLPGNLDLVPAHRRQGDIRGLGLRQDGVGQVVVASGGRARSRSRRRVLPPEVPYLPLREHLRDGLVRAADRLERALDGSVRLLRGSERRRQAIHASIERRIESDGRSPRAFSASHRLSPLMPTVRPGLQSGQAGQQGPCDWPAPSRSPARMVPTCT